MPRRLNSWGALVALALLAGCTGGEIRPASAAPAATGEAVAPAVPALVRLSMTASNTCNISDLREDILQRINALRARGAHCGRRNMPAAPPLAWNDVLFSAAARHSMDMAAHDYFDHTDRRGWQPNQRVSAEGYRWTALAENIAGGDGSVSSVMRGWQRSPDHCEAMLDPAFVDVGVACVERPGSHWGTYWTMELGHGR
jgi:uncharacterized protein YkwD